MADLIPYLGGTWTTASDLMRHEQRKRDTATARLAKEMIKHEQEQKMRAIERRMRSEKEQAAANIAWRLRMKAIEDEAWFKKQKEDDAKRLREEAYRAEWLRFLDDRKSSRAFQTVSDTRYAVLKQIATAKTKAAGWRNPEHEQPWAMDNARSFNKRQHESFVVKCDSDSRWGRWRDYIGKIKGGNEERATIECPMHLMNS